MTLKKSFAILGVFVIAISAHAAELAPIPKDASDRVVHMNLKDSKKYCKSIRKRIPTIKELALNLNPEGVYEKATRGIPLKPVYKRDGSIDFYYDSTTYSQSTGDNGGAWLWSSSGHPDSKYFGMAFNSYDGAINYGGKNSSYESSVRCIDKH